MTTTLSSSRLVGHLAQGGAVREAASQPTLVEFRLITRDARQFDTRRPRFGVRATALCSEFMNAVILAALSWLASLIITGLIDWAFCLHAGDPSLLAALQAPSTKPANGQTMQAVVPGACR